VLELVLLVISIGLVDSLNPTTIIPALYLASGDAPARRTLEFAFGVVAVNLAGGAFLLFGPGRIAVDALPHPGARTVHLMELALGAVAVIAAIAVWLTRARLTSWQARVAHLGQRLALTSGAVIAAVELPTAVPYFAAIAVVAEARVEAVEGLALLALFNLAFIAPVLAIALLARVAGARITGGVERVRARVLAHLGAGVAILLLLLGLGLIGAGAVGLA
jgi:cytochrome c biogenesis protein CcdA